MKKKFRQKYSITEKEEEEDINGQQANKTTTITPELVRTKKYHPQSFTVYHQHGKTHRSVERASSRSSQNNP